MSRAIKAAKFQGDPGLFGFIGKAVSKVTSLAAGAARFGFSQTPLGQAVAIAKAKFGPAAVGFAQRTDFTALGPPPAFTTEPSVSLVNPQGTGRTAIANVEVGTQVLRDTSAPDGCPQGMRRNKSNYFKRTPGGSVVFVPKGMACVKIRRMNAGNTKATRRAISRIKSAQRLKDALSSITIRKKKC